MEELKILFPEITIKEHNFKESCKNKLLEIEDDYRECYGSNDKATGILSDASKFIAARIKAGHESPLEHEKVTVRMITNRAIANELVRHRVGKYSQASTRFINYKDDFKVIYPMGIETEDMELYYEWYYHMINTRDVYLTMLANGAKKGRARGILPLDFATSIVATMDMRGWRNFFKQRCIKAAHEQMRQLAIPLLLYFKENLPGIFDDIPYDKYFPKENYAKVGDYDNV